MMLTLILMAIDQINQAKEQWHAMERDFEATVRETLFEVAA